jgi:hypothetical protein
MKTIRRLYFYAVSIISIEVVMWGIISLLRSMFNARQVVDSASNAGAGIIAYSRRRADLPHPLAVGAARLCKR